MIQQWRIPNVVLMAVLMALTALPTLAVNSGEDLLISGAARTEPWITDLYVMNPNDTVVSVVVYWLKRNQANPSPPGFSFDLGPFESREFPDVILNNFGLDDGKGALRISSGSAVIANALVYADGESGSFGSGFEAVPIGAATTKDHVAAMVGMQSDGRFRTNVFVLSGPDGASLRLELLNSHGVELGSAMVNLGAYQPYLKSIDKLFSFGSLDNGTLLVNVTNGSAVVMGSKIDGLTQDPTTLEVSAPTGDTISDGIYQYAVFDSLLFASGGTLLVVDGKAQIAIGTYMNFDKTDYSGNSECTLLFKFGESMPLSTFEELEHGVIFSETYPDGGRMMFGVVLEFTQNMGFAGVVIASGSHFSGADYGCNGEFPVQLMLGGKMRGDNGVDDEKHAVKAVQERLKRRIEQKFNDALRAAQ